ncbi:hypothetical protein LU699_15240 [Luteimonas fraxinea]|uniref:hypothetical protein n=1 Tax=Luteimonas fraxinea TaxID=2901869 RepID=UPI001E5B58F9|nr:hypothetical protein [Luteimonas fraxinea]UHH09605.1 hypothetical protein LU699_15240 [Luteimonas fraxinea]
MISPRTIWRLLVLPTYILITGAVFALALRNTAGSILSPLVGLAPWVIVMAAGLGMLSILGAALRWRRRLSAVRRVRAARDGTVQRDWEDDNASGVAHHAGPG